MEQDLTKKIMRYRISHEKVWKLFIDFRLHLLSIHEETCLDEMIEEFSDKIINMTLIVFPFVELF